jgi:hypothetical protein
LKKILDDRPADPSKCKCPFNVLILNLTPDWVRARVFAVSMLELVKSHITAS